MDVAVHEGSQTVTDSETYEDDSLPEDFFNRLSEKQRVMLEILLEADGEWMRGVDIRQKMRDEYRIDIGDVGQPTVGIIGGFTRKCDRSFRDDLIAGRWRDESKQHSEHKVGEKYRDELRRRL